MSGKKRKADADAEDSPPEKKHEPDTLGPDEILIKYQAREFRAKLSKLQALCKHPFLNTESKDSFKAGDTWTIDDKTVYLGPAEFGVEQFLKLIGDPFALRPDALGGAELAGLGLCAVYFDAPSLLKRLGAETKTFPGPQLIRWSVDAKDGLNSARTARQLVSHPRTEDNPSFALYCYSVVSVLACFQSKNVTFPRSPEGIVDAQVMYDCLRISRIATVDSPPSDHPFVRVDMKEVMKLLADPK